jgi:DUF4097 and DUF4098 domain-containing protein YvlB
MPTFTTEEPITIELGLAVSDVRIIASDRADTVVEVVPTRPDSKADQRAAEQTRIDFTRGTLSVRTPKVIGNWIGRTGSTDVTIEVPTGSRLEGDTASGGLRSEGRLGEVRFKTAAGSVHLGQTGPLRVTTAAGDIEADWAEGDATLTTHYGVLRLGRVDGDAVLKSSSGNNWIGEANGEVRVSAASGEIVVDRARRDVVVKTAHGGIRIGEVRQGNVDLSTAMGDVEIGIAAGTAAWLEVSSSWGKLRNSLTSSDGPEASDRTVQIRARTYYGDVTIRRSTEDEK